LAICWTSTLPLLPLQDQAFDVDGNTIRSWIMSKIAENLGFLMMKGVQFAVNSEKKGIRFKSGKSLVSDSAVNQKR
jgi:hypothetical protein